jgi:ABC transport system ATP-binding/permease protein
LGLRAAFAEALELQGQRVEAPTLELAADIAQLVVRYRSAEVGEPERDALDEVLRARTDLDRSKRQELIELALSPQFRTNLTLDELRAYEARFGRRAARELESDFQEELTLEGFVGSHGAEESLLLLDALFQVAAADGNIEDREARTLTQAAESLGVDGVLVSALFKRYDPRHASGEASWELEEDRITVGRAAGNDIVLPDPQVARHHCTFVRDGEGWRVVDAGSGRPVLVDGQVVRSSPLKAGAVVRIGPWDLRVDGDTLKADGHRAFTALSMKGLNRHIGDVCLLEGVEFSVFSGELVALVGPSGAGKTTLINAIAGIAPADSGTVELGGADFHAMLANDPSGVGIVPQDDLVHPELKVDESLYYSARLRFPGDVDRSEVDRNVDRVLSELGIEHIRSSRIGDALKRGISGGQRKRVNLGQELLTRNTRVLFLDEPTSGLDPRSAQSIVRQVRQLADDGRIVFLVTHDLTPAIMQLVDHLLVMVPGGRLGYFGPPADACTFFDVASPDLIFDRLESRTAVEWAARFKESPDFRKYVSTRQHLLERGLDQKPEVEPTRKKASGPLTQLLTLTARYARTKMRDGAGLAVLTVQPPILALLIWLVFPVPTTRMAFMLSLSCLWFGMSISVRELIIDRTIWRRERKVGVGVLPFLGSKLIVLAAMNALQCFGFTIMVWSLMQLGGYGFGLFELGMAQVITGFVGVTLGLMLSALYTSSEAAVGTLPLLLIPNICFSSVMVSLRHMDELSLLLTKLTITRYAFDLSLKCGDELEKVGRVAGEWDRQSITGPLYDLGLKGSSVEDMGLSQGELVGTMLAFAAAFTLVTVVASWFRDRN